MVGISGCLCATFEAGRRERSEALTTGFSFLLTGMDMVSDWKETLRLRIVEGHRPSGKRLLDNNFPSTDTGVEGLCGVGEGGVEGLFLSVERDLFGNKWEDDDDDDAGVVLVRFGEGHLRGGAEGLAGGVGDLYLELISLVLERLVVVMVTAFFSARTEGGLTLGVSGALFFPDSHTSIHPN